MKTLFALIFLILFGLQLKADTAADNTIILQSEADLFLVGKQVYFFEDKKGNFIIEDILNSETQKLFQLNDKDIFIRKPSSSVYWFKLIVENQTKKDIWLEFGNTMLWCVDYYRADNGKYELLIETGSLRSEANKAYPSNLFWLPLSNKSDRQVVYVRVKTLRPLEIPIQIGSILSLGKNKTKHDSVMAGFAGLMLFICIYNLFLLSATRDIIYFWYIGYLLTVLSRFLMSLRYIRNLEQMGIACRRLGANRSKPHFRLYSKVVYRQCLYGSFRFSLEI